MKLIIGLGNPGREYECTYHNIGFMAIDKIAKFFDVEIYKLECKALVGSKNIDGEKVFFCKPQTYMNLSGISARELCHKYKIPLEDVIVLVDDIDLPLAKVRYRASGSAGTHNGLKSLVAELGSQNFKRVKIGAGRDPKFLDLADFVLSKIPNENMEKLEVAFDEALEMIKNIMSGKLK